MPSGPKVTPNGRDQRIASRDKGVEEVACGAVVAEHVVAVVPGDVEFLLSVAIGVWSEDEAHGALQPAAAGWHKRIEEGARRPVITQDLVASDAADVEPAVGAEGQARGKSQPAAVGRDEDVDERSGHAVVAEHVIAPIAGDVQSHPSPSPLPSGPKIKPPGVSSPPLPGSTKMSMKAPVARRSARPRRLAMLPT